VELVAFKTTFAVLVLLPLGLGLDLHGWQKLSLLPTDIVGLLVGGLFMTITFQVMLVLMQTVTLATSAGVISLFAVIPTLVIKWIIEPYDLNHVQVSLFFLFFVFFPPFSFRLPDMCWLQRQWCCTP
jgi:hypothetical protein